MVDTNADYGERKEASKREVKTTFKESNIWKQHLKKKK